MSASWTSGSSHNSQKVIAIQFLLCKLMCASAHGLQEHNMYSCPDVWRPNLQRAPPAGPAAFRSSAAAAQPPALHAGAPRPRPRPCSHAGIGMSLAIAQAGINHEPPHDLQKDRPCCPCLLAFINRPILLP